MSLLNADHSTCNGVIPHPSLPIFITYGIDSTAKLWRGTIPVGPHVDDSPAVRLLVLLWNTRKAHTYTNSFFWPIYLRRVGRNHFAIMTL